MGLVKRLEKYKESCLDDDGYVINNEAEDLVFKAIEEIERLKEIAKTQGEALDDIKNVSTLDEYEGSNPSALLRTCYEIAKKAKPERGWTTTYRCTVHWNVHI